MVYYSPYKQFWRAFIRALRTFISSLFSKRLLLMIIVALVIMLLHLNVNAATQTIDIAELEYNIQEERQNCFVLLSYRPFIEDDNTWNSYLAQLYNTIITSKCDIFCLVPDVNNNIITYTIYTYYSEEDYTETTINAYNNYNSQQDTRKNRNYTKATKWDFYYNLSTGTITDMSKTYPANVSVPLSLRSYKSDLMNNFIKQVISNNIDGNINYTPILTDISNYLSSIKDYNSYINYTLSNILTTLNTIANKTENDYTQQITDITDQVNNVSDSIQAQTQQQHQDAQATQNAINNQTSKIEEQTNTLNDMSDFMQDDSFTGDSITNNMPSSDEFQDVTESGFDNIFTTLRNAFTSDNYQDVVFVVPFSNGQTITIPSNLTENIIPTAIKTLIQMVYWYFIARFIVKDIASYIEKAKSGDIFSSSDTNIKTDML